MRGGGGGASDGVGALGSVIYTVRVHREDGEDAVEHHANNDEVAASEERRDGEGGEGGEREVGDWKEGRECEKGESERERAKYIKIFAATAFAVTPAVAPTRHWAF